MIGRIWRREKRWPPAGVQLDSKPHFIFFYIKFYKNVYSYGKKQKTIFMFMFSPDNAPTVCTMYLQFGPFWFFSCGCMRGWEQAFQFLVASCSLTESHWTFLIVTYDLQKKTYYEGFPI